MPDMKMEKYCKQLSRSAYDFNEEHEYKKEGWNYMEQIVTAKELMKVVQETIGLGFNRSERYCRDSRKKAEISNDKINDIIVL